MKTLNILLVTAALASVSTVAFAQPSDSTEQQLAHQLAIGNVKASNDSVGAQNVVEGRQAAQANAAPSATDQFLVDLAVQRDISHH